jgi:hypothetical protein
MLNSVRDTFIKERTATVNRIHAGFLEVGVSLAPGFKSIKEVPLLLEADSFYGLIKKLLHGLYDHYSLLGSSG